VAFALVVMPLEKETAVVAALESLVLHTWPCYNQPVGSPPERKLLETSVSAFPVSSCSCHPTQRPS
jgi:hypothetical protein